MFHMLDGERALQLLNEGIEKRQYSSPLITDTSPEHMIARWDDEKERLVLFIRWTPLHQFYCHAIAPSGIAQEAKNDMSVSQALDWLGDKLCPSV